jgi:DnaJ like chaperone protein
MGHVAKADGRVSEAEIAAARKVMGELRLDGAQIHAAIQHYTRGKNPTFDLEDTMEGLRDACAARPELLRVFLELQVRAALEGVDMQGAARSAIQRVAGLLDVSRLELAHMEAVLRIRREQFRSGGNGGGQQGQGQGQGPSARKSGMSLDAAYQILEVDPKAGNEEVSKAYRRQLSKHHPDKLKANGLPESMLEHAKQRTQQIIEAYDLVKAARGMT